MKPRYSRAIHVERLKEMLASDDPCSYCPAAAGCNSSGEPTELWAETPHPCAICLSFVGIVDNKLTCCPCHCHYHCLRNPIYVTRKKIEDFDGGREILFRQF